MLANVFTKTVRDRWKGITIATAILAIFMLYAMAIYRDIDLGIYTNLPEALRAIMDIPDGADAATLAYGFIYGSYGAMVLAGVAISIGSGSIAGEERKGTIGLLLGNPRSRTSVLVAKAASMVLLIGGAALVLLGTGYAVPAILDVEVGETAIGAIALHLAVNTLFYGFLATAIGGWTGRTGLASGVSAGVMVLSFFAAGILPLFESVEGLAKAFPWYYFDGSEPLSNGIGWGHLAVLLAGVVIFAAVAVAGVRRRDLKSQTTGVTIGDRLRANPATQQAVDRLAGSTRVSRIWVKTLSEHQGLLIVDACVMFLVMGVVIGPMYTWMDDALKTFSDELPEALLTMVGGADLSTPEGFYHVETFGLMAPIAVMVVTVVIGARALAGEEERRTMGLLLANPIRRSRIVIDKSVAMALSASVVGLATFAGVALGSILGGLGMSVGNIAAICVLLTLLGIAFGGLALALSAATGRVSVAVYGTVGLAFLAYVVNGFLPLSDRFAGYARWSPFYYYLGGDVLVEGMNWGYAAVLAILAAVLIAVSVVLFQRRDLRQTG